MKLQEYDGVRKHVELATDELLASEPHFRKLLAELIRAGASVVIFGGFVRDAIHGAVHKERIVARDIDLVFRGKIPHGRQPVIRTKFGGNRILLSSGFKIDYWELEETLAFQKRILPASFSNLLRSTVFTMNACLYDVQSRKLLERGALADIKRKLIAFNCGAYLDFCPEYQAYRALNYAHRLGYALEHDVMEYVTTLMTGTPMGEFLSKVREHRPDTTEEEIRQLIRNAVEHKAELDATPTARMARSDPTFH